MSRLFPLLVLCSVTLGALACSGPPGPLPAPPGKAPPAPAVAAPAAVMPKLVPWTGEQPAAWKEVDALEAEQKYEAAAEKVAELLAAAQARGDSEDVVRAIVRTVQLRTALHGYETSVRFLAETPWPPDLLAQATLNLLQAHSLVIYARAYSWEVRGRERVVSTDEVDLKKWTWDQIHTAAAQSFHNAWRLREALGEHPAEVLAPYLHPNTYPKGIRSTLRDAVTYLWVEALSDRSAWRPEHANEVYRLDLAALLAERAPDVDPAAPDTHPLVKIAALLSDLQAWHAAGGRGEAAFAARLSRLEQLHAAFTEPADQARIRAALQAALVEARGWPWWSMGMGALAEMRQSADDADALIEARRIAAEGQAAYPDSLGGQRCGALVGQIDAPAFELDGMSQDGARRRSLGVQHKHLPELHFRAWRIDLKRLVVDQRDYQFYPQYEAVERLIDKRPPAATWTVSLPATPDHRLHRTWVVPPMTEPGSYVVVASPDASFARMAAPMQATLLTISDLVLTHRGVAGVLDVQVLSGATGEGLAGVEVKLYRHDWQTGHRSSQTLPTDAEGRVRFRKEPVGSAHFLIAERGAHLAVAPDTDFGWAPDRREVAAAMIYTDRSVYRPGQTVHWKVVAYQGSPTEGRYRIAAGAKVSVLLRDANHEVVATHEGKTNEWGSASGEFVVPPGRALGAWTVATPRESNLGGAIRVEEYKRPTFEVELPAPEVALRLNRPAELRGSARYYFGLPVTAGKARWRVVRTPQYPWWWWGARAGTQTVATGESALDDEGRFSLKFTPEADERLAQGEGRAVTYAYHASAEVTDEGGETRTAARTVQLGFVAVQAFVPADRGFLLADQPGDVTIVRTDLDGTPQAGTGRWRLVALDGPEATRLPADEPLPVRGDAAKYATPGDTQRPRWHTAYNEQAVLRSWTDGRELGAADITHDAQGRAAIRLPALAAGAYRLHYATRDAFGADYVMQHELLVAGPAPKLALPAVLRVERNAATVGETVKVLVHSGIPGQAMYLERWRAEERVDRWTLVAGRDPAVVEIPIAEADRGGFGLTLRTARDHQLLELAGTVFVPWDQKTLEIGFETFRDTLRPGQRETWTVRVKGPGAQALAAEVLAYMYDRSLDLFAPHSPPSVASLYPHRASTPYGRSTLGPGQRLWFRTGSFPALPDWSRPAGDRLVFYDAYPIGGLGRGSRRTVAFERLEEGSPPIVTLTAMQKPQALAEAAEPGGDKDADGIPNAADTPDTVDGQPAAPPPGELRSNFSETAFWAPHLTADKDGAVRISFQVPDSVTSWNVWIHAISRDLAGGSLRQEVRTVKELMVRPYLPRFLREGDQARLEVVVNNASDGPLSGTIDFDVLDGDRSVLAELGLSPEPRPFEAKAGGSARASYTVTAPRRLGLLAFKVTARTDRHSDGELRPVPLLPGRVHLAQSRFTTLKGAITKTLRFDDLARNDDPTRIDDQLVVTLDGQLFYGVLSALPYLVNYPYECTEQTLNRFLATGILSSLYQRYPAVARMAKELARRETRLERWDDADPNRKMALEETPWLREARGGGTDNLEKVLDPRVAEAQRKASLARLAKAQTSLGGFPWFPGGPPSPYMTLYLLHGFSKAIEAGVEVPQHMVQRAWSYLKQHHIDEAFSHARKHDCCWEMITFLTYVLSAYPDDSWGGAVFPAALRKEMLDFSFKHWKKHSPYLKAYLSLALHRAGRRDDARLVWSSVLDSAKETPDQGTFWTPEDRSWLWYNDTVETHAFALRTTMELMPDWPKTEGLVLWLFLNKKLNHWKSTKATAEAIYALAHYLRSTDALAAREETVIRVGDRTQTFVFEPDAYTGKQNQVVVPGPEIVPAKHAEVVIEKKTPAGFQLASATWHFSTEKMPAEAHGDFLSVTRTYFRRVKSGTEITLEPLADGVALSVGDEVEVHLSLRSKHALEYVHLRDPRAAGFEPVSLRSEHKWELGIGWYEEIRDSGTNFFFEALPQGEYTFRHRLRATTAGQFKAGPATVQPMYAPELAAYSSGAELTVQP